MVDEDTRTEALSMIPSDALILAVNENGETEYCFDRVLRFFRYEVRGVSQSSLGRSAGYDHSYISRLEVGYDENDQEVRSTRRPTRDAVLRIAAALELGPENRDVLLASALLLPVFSHLSLTMHPTVAQVAQLLADTTIPAYVKEDLQQAVKMAVRQARRALHPEWTEQVPLLAICD